VSGVSTTAGMSESLSYDVMGNIATMNRDGVVGTYNYSTVNRLDNISGGGLATGLYGYDINGNATTDGRTGVSLDYNHLNLPVKAIKTGQVNLNYVYDATGNKLRKLNGMNGTVRHYIDGIEYQNNTLEIIHTDEGTARNNAGTFTYEYNLSDHHGNVRYSF